MKTYNNLLIARIITRFYGLYLCTQAQLREAPLAGEDHGCSYIFFVVLDKYFQMQIPDNNLGLINLVP